MPLFLGFDIGCSWISVQRLEGPGDSELLIVWIWFIPGLCCSSNNDANINRFVPISGKRTEHCHVAGRASGAGCFSALFFVSFFISTNETSSYSNLILFTRFLNSRIEFFDFSIWKLKSDPGSIFLRFWYFRFYLIPQVAVACDVWIIWPLNPDYGWVCW